MLAETVYDSSVRKVGWKNVNPKYFLTRGAELAGGVPIRRSVFNHVTSNDVVYRDGSGVHGGHIRRPNRSVW